MCAYLFYHKTKFFKRENIWIKNNIRCVEQHLQAFGTYNLMNPKKHLCPLFRKNACYFHQFDQLWIYNIFSIYNLIMTNRNILKLMFETKHKEYLNKCEQCNLEGPITKISIKKKRMYYDCGHYVNPLKNTFLHRTRIPLSKWFELLSLFVMNKGGVTSTTASLILNVSQQAAYKNLMKIRNLLQDVDFSNSKILYIDEKFFGSKAKTQHKQKVNSKEYLATRKRAGITTARRKNMQKHKKLTIGIASDDGKYLAEFSGVLTESKTSLVANKNNLVMYEHALLGLFLKHLKNNMIVIIDGDPIIKRMLNLASVIKGIKIKIRSVSHGKNQFVKLTNNNKHIVSTNRIEGFWGRFNRNFVGNYTWCTSQLFNNYTKEFSWRSSNKYTSTKEFLLELID